MEERQNGRNYYENGAAGTADPGTKKKKSHRGLIIFICILVALIVLAAACTAFTNKIVSGFGFSFNTEESEYVPFDPYVALLSVDGVIQSGNTDYIGNTVGYQHDWTLGKIDELIDDENNEGLMLVIDSPGGSVYEIDELYLKIRKYQIETGRPVYAVMESQAASGGYYISAPADKIIANRNCWTGSIGVTMGTFFDISGLLERFDIKAEAITSGPNKAMGSEYQPMTAEQREIFQSLIDEAYEQFVGVIAEGRNMDMEEVKRIGDGRIYTAKQALELSLIDEIGDLEYAKEDMQKSCGLEDCEMVEFYAPAKKVGIFDILGAAEKLTKKADSGELAVLERLMKEGNELRPWYIVQ